MPLRDHFSLVWWLNSQVEGAKVVDAIQGVGAPNGSAELDRDSIVGRQMRISRRIGLSLAAAALIATGFTGNAVAADAPVVSGQGAYCTANLDTGKVGCSDDANEAARLAGSIDALTIAIFYDATGTPAGGAKFTWTQSRECSPEYDPEWQWGNLADIGWNNRVSSVETFHRCDVKLFDGVEFSGATSTWIDRAENLATIGNGWNNRATSVKFS